MGLFPRKTYGKTTSWDAKLAHDVNKKNFPSAIYDGVYICVCMCVCVCVCVCGGGGGGGG